MTMDLRRRGLLFILSSPSGAGKSTISRRLLAAEPDLGFSVSATTRPPRPGERDGADYHFVSAERFAEMVAAGDLLEHATVFGNRYGTPRAPVEAAISAGRDVIFDVDWQGAQQIANSPLRDAAVSVFILPPSIKELEARLRTRGLDSEKVILERMSKAMNEISHWDAYDYIVFNRDIESCEKQVRSILESERLKRIRRPGLVDFVRELAKEFEGRRA